MNLIHTNLLSPSQKKDAEHLVNLCQKHDHISLTLPFEDETDYYLLYDKELLLSVLSAFSLGNDMIECSAFTLPSARRQGYFSDLLDSLDDHADGQDIVFAADEGCRDAKDTLKALKARFWYREYLMEASLEGPCPYNGGPPSVEIQFQPDLSHSAQSGAYAVCDKDRTIGSFLLDVREKEIYFFGFQINEECRFSGLGTAAFKQLLQNLTCISGAKRLLLQVSEDNAPAFSLYQKAGLTVIETLSYYLF